MVPIYVIKILHCPLNTTESLNQDAGLWAQVRALIRARARAPVWVQALPISRNSFKFYRSRNSVRLTVGNEWLGHNEPKFWPNRPDPKIPVKRFDEILRSEFFWWSFQLPFNQKDSPKTRTLRSSSCRAFCRHGFESCSRTNSFKMCSGADSVLLWRVNSNKKDLVLRKAFHLKTIPTA